MDASNQPQGQAMFELGDDEAYAGTPTDIWRAIQAFHHCEVVGLTELTLGEKECLICMLPFDDPENGEAVLHVPVRLPCSHVLGKKCLAERITPFGAWLDTWGGEWEYETGWFEDPFVEFSGSADFPVCRQALFPSPTNAESALGLEARLQFWDQAYARTGCLRSEREERSRADLIRYVEFNRLVNGDTIETQQIDIDQRWNDLRAYQSNAARRLFSFVLRRQEKVLTPIQSRIRRNLEAMSIGGSGAPIDDPNYIQIFPDRQRVSIDTDNESEGTSTESNDINMEDNDHDMSDRDRDMADVGDDEERSSSKSDSTHVEDESGGSSEGTDHTRVEDNDRDAQTIGHHLHVFAVRDSDSDTENAQRPQSFLTRAAFILQELDRVGK